MPFGGFDFGDGGGMPNGAGGQRGGRGQQGQALYDSNSPVKSLNAKKFPGKDAKHTWIVEFYAP
eukprot:752888-Hanusia_phi.AAC.9